MIQKTHHGPSPPPRVLNGSRHGGFRSVCASRGLQVLFVTASLTAPVLLSVRSSLVARSAPSSRSGARDAGPTSTSSPSAPFLLRIAGDGNCLFRSIAHGSAIAERGARVPVLSGAEEGAAAALVRGRICDELEKRREDIEPFLEEPFPSYVANMRRSGVWGGEPELAVAPHVVQRPVQVWTVRGSTLVLVSEYGTEYSGAGAGAGAGAVQPGSGLGEADGAVSASGAGPAARAPVTLFFHSLGHYDVVVM